MHTTKWKEDRLSRPDNEIVYELKPNNPSAVKAGQTQAQGYVDELKEILDGEWTIVTDTY